VVQPLVGSSVVAKDPDRNCFRVHRVLQQEFRRWQNNRSDRDGTESSRDSVCLAAKLLVEAFPRQINGETLRPRATICGQYIQQAVALCDRLKQDKITPRGDDLEALTELLTNSAW
jgi:hypothetical protein